MRYFTGPPQVFDVYRTAIMDALGLPNAQADQPWEPGITYLALSPHETEPELYAGMIADALASGINEITAEEYRALIPPSDEI